MAFITAVKNLLSANHFLDRRCMHCLAPFTPGSRTVFLCSDCKPLLERYTGQKCDICGLPPGSIRIMRTLAGNICERCATGRPAWDKVYYYGLYEGVLKDLLLRFKFDGDLKLASMFAEFLHDLAVNLPKPDIVLAIPQHGKRLRERGYNQAYEIVKSFAKKMGLKPDAGLLQRVKPGIPQEKLTAAQRKANLAGAFRADSAVAGKSVWLTDDILTTGATCNEAAITLKKAGAASVILFIVARTPI